MDDGVGLNLMIRKTSDDLFVVRTPATLKINCEFGVALPIKPHSSDKLSSSEEAVNAWGKCAFNILAS